MSYYLASQIFLNLYMLHLRWRNLGLPDLVMERTPDLGKLIILEKEENKDANSQTDDTRAESLEEYTPDFGEGENDGKDA